MTYQIYETISNVSSKVFGISLISILCISFVTVIIYFFFSMTMTKIDKKAKIMLAVMGVIALLSDACGNYSHKKCIAIRDDKIREELKAKGVTKEKVIEYYNNYEKIGGIYTIISITPDYYTVYDPITNAEYKVKFEWLSRPIFGRFFLPSLRYK